MKKNVLVQYDGGGYDGCIWEWNYFYIDTDGGFHDIASSGTGGIDNLKEAIELMENGKNIALSFMVLISTRSKQEENHGKVSCYPPG